MSSPAPELRLDLARAGDPRAWRTLLARHGPAVWALCVRLTDDPEDAYQEVWERVSGRLARFDPAGPASLATWIGTVARRHLIDRHRRGTVRSHLRLAATPGAPERVPSPGPSPEGALASKREHDRLASALARLPADQRRAVVFHHLQGVPLRRIAEEEGVAMGTIKSRLHRGRAALAELLGAE